jgi:hypothetical protein
MSEEMNQEAANVEQANLPNPFAQENWVDSSPPEDSYETYDANEYLKQQLGIDSWDAAKASLDEYNRLKNSSEEYETYDANEYIKTQLGFDDWDTAKQQLEELRRAKESGFQFENEESKKLYEYIRENKEDDLVSFLQEKKQFDRLYNAEVKDAATAADIVKLSMYQKNKDLDKSEIDFLFNEKFSMPAKPQQMADEFDSDYEQRVSAWENRVNEIEKRLVIEAKLAKPELEKYKSSYVLPELNKQTPYEGPTQEELETRQKVVNKFVSDLDNAAFTFDGFTASVRDEGAEFNVAYTPSIEEQLVVGEQLRYLAENDLNVNMLFADRWVNDDGTVNSRQVARDLFLLQNEGKIMQKYANEAANRRLAMHLKNQSNIHFTNQTQSNTFAPDNSKSEMDRLAAIMFAK